ncbi:formate dehydrogenase subunit alpha [Candidatus Bathyarchaeota archaeon]|nr:formate dehydrogenase subunit alpha [Candidatus Bathyarchaeota archaeon]
MATICPYCGVGCNIYLLIRNGKVTGIQPCESGPGDGKLCIKGWSINEFIHHKDRLTKPLIKHGNRFKEASWEEALDLVSSKIFEAKERFDSNSIAVLASAKATNEENYLIQKFVRAVIGSNNIDHCARLCHSSTVTGLMKSFGSGAMTNSQEDIEEAEVIFVIGSNTTEQHPLLSRRIIRAVKKGAKLIVADPRNIPLTVYATQHLRHRPGTDIALLNGLMYIIFEEGLEDKEFISSRTEGFEAFKDNIKNYSPEIVEKITGVSSDEIKAAGRLYASGKASTFFSMGITQHITGVNNVISIANLAMLTGNIGKPGSGVNPLRGQNNVQGACDVGALPDFLPGYKKLTDQEAINRLEAEWGVSLSREPGLTLLDKIQGAGDKVKVMFIIGENPVMSDPDSNHVKAQLQRLDFLVVSELFMSETAKLADVVLPAASFAEKDGTFTATDRRIQLLRKGIEPIGDSKPDWWMIQQLSNRLGYNMVYGSTSEIMDEIARVTPIYAGVSHKRLENGDLRWPVNNINHAGTPILHNSHFINGKGKFHIVNYRPPSEEPDREFPLILTTGRVLNHWHTGTMTRRSPTLVKQGNTAFIEINPVDAKERGITENSLVRVRSRRGGIIVKSNITSGILPGVVFIPFHFSEAAANILTNIAIDPEARIPEYKVCAVEVELISEII